MPTRKEMVAILKEIAEGKDGQTIPYNIIVHSIVPLADKAALPAVIYLLENLEDEEPAS